MRTTILILLIFCTLLLSAQEPKLMLPIGHAATITTANFSPDGKYIVTGGKDNMGKIWLAATGQLIHDLNGHLYHLEYAEFSPDSKEIVTASDDKYAAIWYLETGKAKVGLYGHTDSVILAKYSPNGKLVVTASRDKTAKLWAAANGQLLYDLKGHTGGLNYAEFSPDGKLLITASNDSTARVWEFPSGELKFILKGHTGSINDARFSADGNYIATASDDSTAKIWDAGTGRLIKILKGHEDGIYSVRFRKDGKFIITGGWDNSAKLWEFSTGSRVADFRANKRGILGGGMHYALFSPDGKNILVDATGDSTYKLYNGEGKWIKDIRHGDEVTDLTFSKDGKFILGAFHQYARTWNIQDPTRVISFKGHTHNLEDARFSQDGKYIYTVPLTGNSAGLWDAHGAKLLRKKNWVSISLSNDGLYFVTTNDSSYAQVWNMDENLVKEIKVEGEAILRCFFSNDSRYLAAVLFSGFKIWRVEDWELIASVESDDYIPRAAFTTDSKFIIAGSMLPRAWKIDDPGKPIIFLPGHYDLTTSLAISPDNRFALTASQDHTAKLWKIADGSLVHTFEHEEMLNSARFSPDGNRIVTASRDRWVRIWDAASGKLLDTLSGHHGQIVDAEFDNAGERLLSCSDDQTAIIWDLNAKKPLFRLTGHESNLHSAHFSPDNKEILTTSYDHTLRKWNAETGQLLYTFFAVDSLDYLVIDKDGRYDGTSSAKKLVYYTCGPEIIELQQFKELGWQPSLAEKINRGDTASFSAIRLSDINICGATPLVEDAGSTTTTYNYSITPRKAGFSEAWLFLNDKRIKVYPKSKLQFDGTKYLLSLKKNELKDRLVKGENNIITVKAITDNGKLQSRGGDTNEDLSDEKRDTINVFVISAGISEYKGDDLKLTYAAKDAIDFSQTIVPAARKLFEPTGSRVTALTLSTDGTRNNWPTKENIAGAFRKVAGLARASDIVVIFLSGHGVLDGKKQLFYYLTSEASAFDLSGVEKQVAISSDELNEWLTAIKARKQVLILDACNSGQALQDLQSMITKKDIPDDQKRALDRMKDRTGTYILSASASGKPAYETSLYGQGLLTYSLLFAIKSGAALREDKFIDISKWFNEATDNVSRLAMNVNGRQEPQVFGNASFDVGLADRPFRETIPISSRKMQFARSSFITDPVLQLDDEGISELVNHHLLGLSAKGSQSPLAYFGENSGPDAYSIRGQYEVKGNEIKVKVTVIKGLKEPVLNFEKTGSRDKKQVLAAEIVQYVLDNIISH